MNIDETKGILTLANALDARVQVNKPTLDLWARVLHSHDFPACHAAVNLFYERYSEPTNRPVVDAPAIRRIIGHETERAIAKTSALEAGPAKIRNPLSYRARNPELWDRLYQDGLETGNAERASNARRRAAA